MILRLRPGTPEERVSALMEHLEAEGVRTSRSPERGHETRRAAADDHEVVAILRGGILPVLRSYVRLESSVEDAGGIERGHALLRLEEKGA